MSDGLLLGFGLGAIFLSLGLGFVLLASRRPQTGVNRSLAYIDQLAIAPVVGQYRPVDEPIAVPFAASMAALARRLSPSSVAQRLQRRLDIAGNPAGLTPDRLLGFKGLALVAGGSLGALFGARHGVIALLVGAAVMALAGFYLPDVLVYNSGLKRQDALRRTLPDALDMLTISVEAGLGFDAALSQVARNTTGPLSGEFFRVLQEMQIGKSRAQAFQDLAERTTVAELQVFVSALVQADRQGIPVASVLREQAREMRLKRRQRAEEAAAKAPVKILFPLVVCIFPTMFVVIIGPGVIQIVHAFSGRL
ncbi:MAG: type II secretion system F family protein [Actinomycetes bacterium]